MEPRPTLGGVEPLVLEGVTVAIGSTLLSGFPRSAIIAHVCLVFLLITRFRITSYGE